MKIDQMDEKTIADIGHAFAYYDYGAERGLVSAFAQKEQTAIYIEGFACAMLKAGLMYTTGERQEGFIAYKRPGQKISVSAYMPLLKGVVKSMSFGEMIRFARSMGKGGTSLRQQMDKAKTPYIYVGMVCVREAYQGQGYMRKVLEMAFEDGNRLHVPVVLETDAKSKCDKYVHLGMTLDRTRDLGDLGKLYDLIKYPEKEHAK